jgi:hypothetical protein
MWVWVCLFEGVYMEETKASLCFNTASASRVGRLA